MWGAHTHSRGRRGLNSNPSSHGCKLSALTTELSRYPIVKACPYKCRWDKSIARAFDLRSTDTQVQVLVILSALCEYELLILFLEGTIPPSQGGSLTRMANAEQQKGHRHLTAAVLPRTYSHIKVPGFTSHGVEICEGSLSKGTEQISSHSSADLLETENGSVSSY